MEKSIVKKKLHLKPEEKKYVAKMIDNGGSLQDVDRWYQMRFGKKITTSVYYRLKQQCKTILADTKKLSILVGEIFFSDWIGEFSTNPEPKINVSSCE